ncbi:MAG: hypothetical protein ABW154_10515 [Dyella sp.]
MLNSIASGRRLAWRIALLQLGVAASLGLVFMLRGYHDALAASAGAGVVALGTVLMSLRTFASLAGPATTMLRLLSGVILKWVAVLGGMVVILGQFKLPPLAALTGLVVAYAVNLLAFRFKG